MLPTKPRSEFGVRGSQTGVPILYQADPEGASRAPRSGLVNQVRRLGWGEDVFVFLDEIFDLARGNDRYAEALVIL